LVNAFVEREPDEWMKWLYDEIIIAKDSILDSKHFKQESFLPKWILYLKNLLQWVEERLNRWDLADWSVKLWELTLVESMIKDLENDYYTHQGLKMKKEDKYWIKQTNLKKSP